MLVNHEVINELYESAGNTRASKAEKYILEDRVNIKKIEYEDEDNFEIYGIVKGETDIYNVGIIVQDGEVCNLECTCPDHNKTYGTCKHILALLIEFMNTSNKFKNQKNIEKTENYRNFKQIVKMFYDDEVNSSLNIETENYTINDNIKLISKLCYDRFNKELRVEFKIGDKQLYKIKNLSEFYDRFLNNDIYKYGAKLEFVHNIDIFNKETKDIINFILKYAEIIKYVNNSSNYRYRYYGKILNESYIILENSGLDEIFELLKGKNILLDIDKKEKNILLIPSSPNIDFKIKKINSTEFAIYPNIDVQEYILLEGKVYSYILIDNVLYRINIEFKNTILKLLEMFRKNYTKEIKLNKNQLPEFFSIIMPKIKERIDLSNIDKDEVKKYIPEELEIKIFLDFNDKNHITLDAKFFYGKDEFNPINLTNIPKIPRNIIKETEFFNIINKTRIYDR